MASDEPIPQELIDNFHQLIMQYNEEMNKIYRLCVYGQYSINSPIFFIPYGQMWTVESPLSCSLLTDQHGKIQINVTSTYQNQQIWQPQWLFNGKTELEINGQNGWATEAQKPSSIIITFEHEVDANVLSITSRTQAPDQAPTGFEIWAGEDPSNLIIMREFTNIIWGPTQQKLFSFDNDKYYHIYKIVFKTSNSTIFGFSELNLGKLEINSV